MTQPLATPPPASQPPPQPHPAGGSVQVRCAGCRMILTVGPGITEFVCPSCKMPQMLPPELMKKAVAPPLLNNSNMLHKMTSQSQPQMLAYGIDPSKMQLPCANCKAILNVPRGLARFQCPQCFVDLAVDLSKIKQLFPPHATPPLPLPPPSRTVLPLPPLPRLVLPPPPSKKSTSCLCTRGWRTLLFRILITVKGDKRSAREHNGLFGSPTSKF
uniref:Zinc finger LSD1-type domain-containing protein n=1 Tax=Populus davidiana TaxID=266767 RepID=A0A6M2FB48_9ROSI